jgi:hypothetical protein
MVKDGRLLKLKSPVFLNMDLTRIQPPAITHVIPTNKAKKYVSSDLLNYVEKYITSRPNASKTAPAIMSSTIITFVSQLLFVFTSFKLAVR